jgi:hypothetical protein
MLIISSHLSLGLQSGLYPSGSPPKSCVLLSPPPTRATCHAHPILLYFITRTILGEQYRSLSSSLFSFLHSPVTSSFLALNILLNICVCYRWKSYWADTLCELKEVQFHCYLPHLPSVARGPQTAQSRYKLTCCFTTKRILKIRL